MKNKVKVFEVGYGDGRKEEFRMEPGEILEEQINQWLQQHPNVNVFGMYPATFSHDHLLCILFTIHYSDDHDLEP